MVHFSRILQVIVAFVAVMTLIFNNLFSVFVFNDAPEPYQIGFQDGASPGFSGIQDLHDSIFFYLLVISVGVFWIMYSVMTNFSIKNSPITYKYQNHGNFVPIQNYSKFLNKFSSK